MKKLALLFIGLFLVNVTAFADDHHIDVALEHATAATIYGKNGHTSVLLEHAKIALEHVLAASLKAQGVSKSHLESAAEDLEEAISQSESGHVGTATRHARAAVGHIKNSEK
ncbi:small metal-binding protein SmbP [Candidatus Methylobacter oryzae]|uniref:Metal-binding protein SmbP n=1 Tax=Candidatus Methylobacter oryzae TaxID=2497749 RepID=A0ABY3C751_9GAMM|nr:small metal-binding protein SmbP [Candidatus Methylobacter oryzae]TRW91245.1 hypothetical protein EKO24_017695 [Candidatus Methylobacter oryzae]